MKRRSLEDLRKEYVGQSINWLTILSVDPNPNGGHAVCTCKCKCGKVCIKELKKVAIGHTKSCGCYNSSKEKGAKHSRYFKEHPESVDSMRLNLKKWRNDNPDKVAEISKNISKWYADNPSLVEKRSESYSKWYNDNPEAVHQHILDRQETVKSKRIEILSDLIRNNDVSFIHPDDLDKLKAGLITAKGKIRTKCPICHKYFYHAAHTVIHLLDKSCSNRLCKQCTLCYSQSKQEDEIADFVSTFYNGQCVRNTRDIISPLELDLYYPEKKIAIEFNGDYWHSNEYKSNDYHYNKFTTCRNNNVLLVSIFESDWLNSKDLIKSYLTDLFNNIENKLSFNDDMTLMNNNYPSPKHHYSGDFIESYYDIKNYRVYTCGYTHINN